MALRRCNCVSCGRCICFRVAPETSEATIIALQVRSSPRVSEAPLIALIRVVHFVQGALVESAERIGTGDTCMWPRAADLLLCTKRDEVVEVVKQP